MANGIFGLAYGFGAGTANLPQSYMAGQQAAQGLQYNQMRNDKLAGDIAEEEAMNAALAQGYQIAQEKLGPNASPDELASTAYGHALTAAAQSGKGGAMVQRILPAYTASAEKKKMAEQQRQRQILTSAAALDPNSLTPMINSAYGTKFKSLAHGPDNTIIATFDEGDTVSIPREGFIGALMGDPKSQAEAGKLLASRRATDLKGKIAGEKQGLEERKFKYKSEVFDHQYLEILRLKAERYGLRGGASDAYIRRVEYRTQKLIDQGVDPKEAAKIAGDEFLPGAMGARGEVSNQRQVLTTAIKRITGNYAALPGGLSPAAAAKVKDPVMKQQMLDDLTLIGEYENQLKGIVGIGKPKPKAGGSSLPPGFREVK